MPKAVTPGVSYPHTQGVQASKLAQPGYHTDFKRMNLDQAQLYSQRSGRFTAADVQGWWSCGFGRTYMYPCGDDCLCGIYCFALLIPCPCVCACSGDGPNTFLWGRGMSDRLVVMSRDSMLNYSVCCDGSPMYDCRRVDNCVGC